MLFVFVKLVQWFVRGTPADVVFGMKCVYWAGFDWNKAKQRILKYVLKKNHFPLLPEFYLCKKNAVFVVVVI